MENKRKTVVIHDANVWISFLIGSDYGKLIDALYDPNYRFIVCRELLNELRDVCRRPKFRKWFTMEFVKDLLEIIRSRCKLIEIENKPQPILRDPNDSYLINLAEQGGADILVSNDKDITSLKGQIGKLKIFSLAEFMNFYIQSQRTKEEIPINQIRIK